MTEPSRRTLLRTGLAATAGLAGLGAVARAAQSAGLIPPDHGGLWGPGQTLTYASQRLITRHSLAREFPRSAISPRPLANEIAPLGDAFRRLEAGGFADWRLRIDGLVARPGEMTMAQIRAYPVHTQITQLACEEGWSYVAEWIGVPLSHILELAGIRPEARFVVYASIQSPEWWDSIDMADALHPQTLLVHGMNGGPLPVGNGGPLRMRVPRQLGYKSVKFINRITVTDSLKPFGKGLGSPSPEPGITGYSWYAGI